MKTVSVIINPTSGIASDRHAEIIKAACEKRGISVLEVFSVNGNFDSVLQKAERLTADGAIVHAGDGTIRSAMEKLRQPVLPLPGGTLNWFSRAAVGDGHWEFILKRALDTPSIRMFPAGEINGERFFLCALMGEAAHWQKSREALRGGRVTDALSKAKHALVRSIARHPITANGRAAEVTGDTVIAFTATASARHDDFSTLEVAALNHSSAQDLLRLGFDAITEEWRNSPQSILFTATDFEVTSTKRIAVLIDGEFRTVPAQATVTMLKEAAPVWGAA